jgi:hypothetical protein
LMLQRTVSMEIQRAQRIKTDCRPKYCSEFKAKELCNLLFYDSECSKRVTMKKKQISDAVNDHDGQRGAQHRTRSGSLWDVLAYRSPAWPSGSRIKVNRCYKPQCISCRSLYVKDVPEIPSPLRSCCTEMRHGACVQSMNPEVHYCAHKKHTIGPYPDPV